MNPSDLAGRDLDLAVTKRLGYVWWAAPNQDDRADYGVYYLREHEHPPSDWHRIDAPGPEYGSPWLPGYDCDGGRIPELFAEIRKRVGLVQLVCTSSGKFNAYCMNRDTEVEVDSEGPTPNEALARLLLMVAQR